MKYPTSLPLGAGIFPADGLPDEALTEADLALVEAARHALAAHYKPFWHMVAAALRGRDGRIWTGIHLGATVGRMQVCAEAIALGRAVLEGDGTVACAVAVRHPKPHEDCQDLAVVPPCGACREMLTDFDPGCRRYCAARRGFAAHEAAAFAASALSKVRKPFFFE